MSDDFDDDVEREALKAVLGPRVKAARKQQRLTQVEAGELAGVTGEFFARIERGYALPSVRTLVGIASALDISVDYLIGASDEQVSKVRLPRIVQERKLSRVERGLLDRARGDRELTRWLLATLKLFEQRAERGKRARRRSRK